MIEITLDMNRIKQECVWFAVIFGAVTMAMMLDLIAGVYKARKRHEATTSKGLKRTADKSEKYYLPLLCCACFDIVVSPLSTYPMFTAIIGLYLIICEMKSIMENTRTKKELRDAEKTMNVIVKNKDDIKTIITETLKNLHSQEENENPEKDD